MTTETRHEVPSPREDHEEPKKYRSNVRPAPYRIPSAPPIAWAPGNSKRRAWLSRIVLFGLLIMQAILTLRLRNTVYEGETSILPSNGDFHGGTALYPALSEAVQTALGVQGMRAFSLIFMICATGLLYSFSTRLFNERVGLAAAGSYSVIAPTLVAGALATEDALAVLLLAGAMWLVVLSRSGPAWPLFAAAPVAVLAVAVKYGAVFYLPSILLLAVLVTTRHTSVGQAFVRSSGLLVALLIGLGLYASGASGAPAAVPLGDLASGWIYWLGTFLAFGLFGAGFYIWKARMGEVPVGADAEPGRGWRVALSLAFLLPGLIAPLLLVGTAFEDSLWRLQFAFAGLLGATMTGVGLVRMIGRHFRFPQVGIIAAIALLALGMAQSEYEYTLWPNYTNLAKVLDESVEPAGKYLAASPEETFSSYMKEYRPAQWTSLSTVVDKGLDDGGLAQIKGALRKGTYEMIVVQYPAATPVDEALLAQLRAGTGDYRVLTGVPFRLGWTVGAHQLWVKNLAGPAAP